jgi:hypothetical protein
LGVYLNYIRHALVNLNASRGSRAWDEKVLKPLKGDG